ncbi:hypothetical protein CDL12_16948 [Handroanthus impetiginosus]|uniref:Uncharacterized protein n=1 Tax=Handroanthus impetiginosus TaxID=429701 RepID=A0A2G9GYW5_9LAMI|nr:hypothetical protein CDL12_16948 [Handroanthus impetiginosus]
MLRSRSRSGSVDFGQKNNHLSVFSRTLSASKLCRGDALGSQINTNALKSVDKKPSTFPNLSEIVYVKQLRTLFCGVFILLQNQINIIMSMQKRMGELEEELKRARQKRSADDMRLKQEPHQAKSQELIVEIENIKKLLSHSRNELKIKDKTIESLELELDKARKFELVLTEKDMCLDKLREDLRHVRDKEQDMILLLSENKKRIQQLEAEVEMKKQLESKMAEPFAVQTKQLEEAKIELEESKIEISSLRDKVESLQELSMKNDRIECSNREEEIKGLVYELQITKENLAHAQEVEEKASLKAKNLTDERELLKNELELAVEAEEMNTKALEDLALALKEVATEANQAKEKLKFAKLELEHVKEEAKQLKNMLRSTDETYQKLLNEAKLEAELHKEAEERLRLEAEEMISAWKAKEMGFVTCIRRAEEERAIVERENEQVAEELKVAEDMRREVKQETCKLRDIVKQAVSEANAAKAAAEIARDENSQLKDCLSKKEEALQFLTRENERLWINEAAAREDVEKLKRLVSTLSQDINIDDIE